MHYFRAKHNAAEEMLDSSSFPPPNKCCHVKIYDEVCSALLVRLSVLVRSDAKGKIVVVGGAREAVQRELADALYIESKRGKRLCQPFSVALTINRFPNGEPSLSI